MFINNPATPWKYSLLSVGFMRLTTVYNMDLRPGMVLRYDVTAQPYKTSSTPPISFDQKRHCSLGPRPGSWMAVAFALPSAATDTQLEQAWLQVIQRHETLRTRVVNPSNPALEMVHVSSGQWSAARPSHPRVRLSSTFTSSTDPRRVLREIFDEACDPFATPSHQMCVVDHTTHIDPQAASMTGDGDLTPHQFTDATVVIGLDHCHTDAWSLLVLIRDFTAFLHAIQAGTSGSLTPSPVLPPAHSFGEHTRDLLARPLAPAAVHSAWKRIMEVDGQMPTFPLPLGDLSEPRDQVVKIHDVVDAEGLQSLETAAQKRGVRLLGVAVAAMAPLKAVFPVHSRRQPFTPPRTWAQAMGWFITNSVIRCSSSDPQEAMKSVKEAIKLGSYPLEPLLEPWGGMPHTTGMLAVSWLDNRKLPVQVDPALDPQHVSAEIKVNGVMLWFVVNHDGMHIRVRYPDTPEARSNVSGWCRSVCESIREFAGTSHAAA